MVIFGKLLYSCPKMHMLEYCSCMARKVIGQAPKTVTVVIINGTLKENLRAIPEEDPISYWGVGHGSVNLFTVECKEVFLDTRMPERLELMKDRVVHLLSCYTAVELGPKLIEAGVAASIGYSAPFVFGVRREGSPGPEPCEEPDDERDCYTFGDCDLEVQRKLMRGDTVEGAWRGSQAKFFREINRYQTGDRKEWWIAPWVARFLGADMGAQWVYGKLDAAVAPKVRVIPVWAIAAGLGVGAFGLLAYRMT